MEMLRLAVLKGNTRKLEGSMLRTMQFIGNIIPSEDILMRMVNAAHAQHLELPGQSNPASPLHLRTAVIERAAEVFHRNATKGAARAQHADRQALRRPAAAKTAAKTRPTRRLSLKRPAAARGKGKRIAAGAKSKKRSKGRGAQK
jgi:hypothetical protein